MIRYEDMNDNEKRIYEYLSIKPHGVAIHDLYSEFEDMGISGVQAVVMRFHKSKMFSPAQISPGSDCPWFFELRHI